MTTEERKEIDGQVIWARLKLSIEEFEEWKSIHLKPSCDEFPDGLFYSPNDWADYFNVERY